MKKDLINYDGGLAVCIDPDDRISRYILFKVADFCVHNYGYWRRYVFEENDISREELLQKGIRHDISGSGRPVLRESLGGKFDLSRGLPKTVDDATLLQVYHGKFDSKESKYDAEEMTRRYRFSVVVTKLIEALYRFGYDLESAFRLQVQACNSMSEQTTAEATLSPSQLKAAVGSVETAMKEAIRIAFSTVTYSFFSELDTPDNFKFNMAEFQSFLAFKGKSKVTGEMVHVMHFYGIKNVPVFEELVSKYKAKNENKPVKLKFLTDTPLSSRRGFNMLMPESSTGAPETSAQDVPMEESTQAEDVEKEDITVEVVV